MATVLENGGNGGAASAFAVGGGLIYGDTYAHATGGDGGRSSYQGGDGGSADAALSTAKGYSASARVTQVGGAGGAGVALGFGGSGGDATDGTATTDNNLSRSASATVQQTGGAGGDSADQVAGRGGSAKYASATSSSRDGGVSATVQQTGGAGGSSQGRGGAGGLAVSAMAAAFNLGGVWGERDCAADRRGGRRQRRSGRWRRARRSGSTGPGYNPPLRQRQGRRDRGRWRHDYWCRRRWAGGGASGASAKASRSVWVSPMPP